jgi:hypothetical protein
MPGSLASGGRQPALQSGSRALPSARDADRSPSGSSNSRGFSHRIENPHLGVRRYPHTNMTNPLTRASSWSVQHPGPPNPTRRGLADITPSRRSGCPWRGSGRPWRAESAAVIGRVFGDIRRDPSHRPGQYVNGRSKLVDLRSLRAGSVGGRVNPTGSRRRASRPAGQMDVGKVDENLELFNQTVLPDIKATPGFLGVRLVIQASVRVRDASKRSGQTNRLFRPSCRRRRRDGLGRIPSVELGDHGVLEIRFRSE